MKKKTRKWKEPSKRAKADWEGKLVLDIVDMATAVIRLIDSIAIAVCKMTTLRDELVQKLTGAEPEQLPAAIKAWQEMAALKFHSEWPLGAPVNLPTPTKQKKKKPRRR